MLRPRRAPDESAAQRIGVSVIVDELPSGRLNTGPDAVDEFSPAELFGKHLRQILIIRKLPRRLPLRQLQNGTLLLFDKFHAPDFKPALLIPNEQNNCNFPAARRRGENTGKDLRFFLKNRTGKKIETLFRISRGVDHADQSDISRDSQVHAVSRRRFHGMIDQSHARAAVSRSVNRHGKRAVPEGKLRPVPRTQQIQIQSGKHRAAKQKKNCFIHAANLLFQAAQEPIPQLFQKLSCPMSSALVHRNGGKSYGAPSTAIPAELTCQSRCRMLTRPA